MTTRYKQDYNEMITDERVRNCKLKRILFREVNFQQNSYWASEIIKVNVTVRFSG